MFSALTKYIAGRPVLRLLAQRLYCRISRHVILLPPLGVALETTYSCNWRCKMCFHHRPEVHAKMAKTISERKAEELTTTEIKSLVDELVSMGVRHLSLHGGEPLIRPDFSEILEYAATRGLHVTAFTNATLMTGEIAEAMVRFMPELGVSIHGGEQVHDAITGISGSFQKSIAGVRLIQKTKMRLGSKTPQIHLTCVVTADNCGKLDEMVAVAADLGLDRFGLSLPTFTSREAIDDTYAHLPEPCGAKCFLGDSLVDASVLKVESSIYKASIERMKAAAERAGISVIPYPFSSEQEIAAYFANPFFTLGGGCDYLWYSSVVSAFGDIYPCIQLSFLGFRMGNLRDGGFRKTWKNTAYREFRRKFLESGRHLSVCSKCCSVFDES